MASRDGNSLRESKSRNNKPRGSKSGGVSKSKGAQSFSIFFGLAFVIGAIASVTFGYFAYKKILYVQQQSSSSVAMLQQELDSRKRTGYVTITDIKCGDIVTAEMLQPSSNIISDVHQSKFFSDDDIGKQAIMNIDAGTPVFKEMVSATFTENYREGEYSCIWLNSNISDSDYVDIRVKFPNGEDYIVCAKKCIKSVTVAANNAFFWMTEDEIQLLNSAIVDANMHNAKIYVTKYLKPEVQEASIVTYSPNEDVLKVIQSDKNAVNRAAANLSASARAAMVERITLFESIYGTDAEGNSWKNPYSGSEYPTDSSAGSQEPVQPDSSTSTESDTTNSTAGSTTNSTTNSTAQTGGDVTYD